MKTNLTGLVLVAENTAALGAIVWGAHGLWGGPVAAIVGGGLILVLNIGAILARGRPRA